jgi:predicted ATPase
MLMDLFLQPPGEAKQRIHFHAFMQDIHQAAKPAKLMVAIARDLAKQAQVCASMK